MNVAIFGATGLLGPYVAKAFEVNNNRIIRISNKTPLSDYQMDASDMVALETFFKNEKVDVVINAVKSSISTDASEVEKTSTWNANVIAAENLARLQRSHGFLLVHISTDWIFEGKNGEVYRNDSIPYPVNFYSFSKAIAEEKVKNIASEYLIFRPTGIFGIDQREANFFMRVKKAAKNNEKVNAPNDQFSQPIFAGELAALIKTAVDKKVRGIYNAVGPDYVSRYDLGILFCEVFGWDKNLVVASQSGQRAIRVPNYLRLDISKTERDIKKLNSLKEQIKQLKGEIN